MRNVKSFFEKLPRERREKIEARARQMSNDQITWTFLFGFAAWVGALLMFVFLITGTLVHG